MFANKNLLFTILMCSILGNLNALGQHSIYFDTTLITIGIPEGLRYSDRDGCADGIYNQPIRGEIFLFSINFRKPDYQLIENQFLFFYSPAPRGAMLIGHGISESFVNTSSSAYKFDAVWSPFYSLPISRISIIENAIDPWNFGIFAVSRDYYYPVNVTQNLLRGEGNVKSDSVIIKIKIDIDIDGYSCKIFDAQEHALVFSEISETTWDQGSIVSFNVPIHCHEIVLTFEAKDSKSKIWVPLREGRLRIKMGHE